MNISIIRNGVEIGEWTENEVRDFYREGRLVDTDSYWREGMNEWAPISRLIRPAPPFPTKLPTESLPSFPISPPPLPSVSQKNKNTATQKFNIPKDISEDELEADLAVTIKNLTGTQPDWIEAATKYSPRAEAPASRSFFTAKNAIFGILAIWFLVFIYWGIFGNHDQYNQGLPPQPQDAASQQLSQPKPAFNQPQLPLPQNGEETPSYTSEAVAPLTIQTPAGNNHYFIKVVDANDPKQVITTFFIQGGMSYETKVPLGSYLIKYATGTTWYGPQYLFGPDTIYNMADDTFNFTETADGYSGHTIELILQQNGNLNVKPMSPQDW